MVHEFIVWDKQTKSFLEKTDRVVFMPMSVDNSSNYTILSSFIQRSPFYDYMISLEHIFVDSKECFSYIGKTDIDGKKIYADCSIVKMDYGLFSTHREVTGYFSYSLDRARYDFIGLDDLEVNWLLVRKLEVIGTLQQNKDLLNA